jgi:prepilin peptidase CpaA
MVLAASSDLASRTIRNWLIIALLIAYIVLAPLAGFSLAEVISGIVAGALVLIAFFALFTRGWMGGGDVKLASVSALWLGSDQTASYLLYAALAGGVLTLAVLLLRALSTAVEHPLWVSAVGRSGSGVPYGVALASAGLMLLPASRWAAL